MFEIVYAFLAHLVFVPLSKLYYWVKGRIEKIARKIRNRGEKQIQRTETLNSLHPTSPGDYPAHFIADAMDRNRSLVANPRVHFTNLSNTFHISRRLRITPFFNGEPFIEPMCAYLSRQVVFQDSIDLTLCLRKQSNELFVKHLSDHFPKRIKNHYIVYKEKYNIIAGERSRSYRYEQDESMQGTNVVLIESLHIFPDVLVESVKWINDQGANIRKVVILFNGTNRPVDLSGCGLSNNVIIACNVDLKLIETTACNCASSVWARRLKYSDY